MNNYVQVDASVRTATHGKTQLDHSQFTENKIKCLHLFKLAAPSEHSGGLGHGLHAFLTHSLPAI